MPSKFDQEVNPFEQSFRASSHHDSTGSLSDREKSSRRNSPPRGGDETSTKHNALPPLSSLTSPAAADPSQFPWLASQSLRTGPLSPAMLAGPQGQNGTGNRAGNGENGHGEHQAFDASQFRTGFTPGTGSGFTPGYNSLMNGNNFSNLPLPSPNTAAFLNMVTNATPLGEGESGSNEHSTGDAGGQGQGPPPHPPSSLPPHMQHQHSAMSAYSQQGDQQDTITPGTFSALTGAINDMNRANGHHPQQGGPPPPHAHGMQQQSSYYNMNGPAPHHQQHPQHPVMMHGGMPPHALPGGGGPHPPHIDYAQQSANAASQAANGLFLLSQAHQELSKREEEGRGSTPLMNKRTSVGAVPPGSGKGPNSHASGSATSTNGNGINGIATTGPGGGPGGAAGTKRKSTDAGTAGGVAPGPKGKKGKKAAAAAAAAAAAQPSPIDVKKDEESVSPGYSGMGDMSMEMDMDDEDGNRLGRPETEEEKRKNFLERNRQGELRVGARAPARPPTHCPYSYSSLYKRTTLTLYPYLHKRRYLACTSHLNQR